MAVAALAEAGAALGRPDWIAAAEDVGEFLLGALRRPDGRWLRVLASRGQAAPPGLRRRPRLAGRGLHPAGRGDGPGPWIAEARTTADALIELFSGPGRGRVRHDRLRRRGPDRPAQGDLRRGHPVGQLRRPPPPCSGWPPSPGSGRYRRPRPRGRLGHGAGPGQGPDRLHRPGGRRRARRRASPRWWSPGTGPTWWRSPRPRLPARRGSWPGASRSPSPLWEGRTGAGTGGLAFVCRDYTCAAPTGRSGELTRLRHVAPLDAGDRGRPAAVDHWAADGSPARRPGPGRIRYFRARALERPPSESPPHYEHRARPPPHPDFQRSARTSPGCSAAPGTTLELLVLAADGGQCAGIDLASGALVRAWSPVPSDHRPAALRRGRRSPWPRTSTPSPTPPSPRLWSCAAPRSRSGASPGVGPSGCSRPLLHPAGTSRCSACTPRPCRSGSAAPTTRRSPWSSPRGRMPLRRDGRLPGLPVRAGRARCASWPAWTGASPPSMDRPGRTAGRGDQGRPAGRGADPADRRPLPQGRGGGPPPPDRLRTRRHLGAQPARAERPRSGQEAASGRLRSRSGRPGPRPCPTRRR